MDAGEALRGQSPGPPETAAARIALTLDSTFIRSCGDGERQLEVRIGNVETETGGRQVFAAVRGADTDIGLLIRRNLDAVGRGGKTALTAFTDGCSGLRRILAEAGVADPPIRRSSTGFISPCVCNTSSRSRASCQPMAASRRQRNRRSSRRSSACAGDCGMAKPRKGCRDQHGSHPRRHASFQGREGWAKVQRAVEKTLGRTARARWLSHRLKRPAGQLCRQTSSGIAGRNRHHRRDRQFPGEPPDELYKSQQMCWSRRGADLLLQVRCAVYNGKFNSRFGQKFHPANDLIHPIAHAA